MSEHRRSDFGWLRWLSGVGGAVLLLVAVGLLLGGGLLIRAGSFGILMGTMALLMSLGVGTWGWVLLTVALNGRKSSWTEVDEEVARRSPAVQRFDALHRPTARDVDGDGD